jgi:F-type H+-transporting ATPase subunit delta
MSRAREASGSVGRVYAEALFAVAKEGNAVVEILGDIVEVERVFGDNARFATLIESPKVTRDEAAKMIRGAFEGKIAKPVLNLLLVLLKRGRQRAIPEVAEAFRALVDADRRQRRVAITTATPIEPAHAEKLASTLAQKIGLRVLLETAVDPALLGGAVARVGDTVIDGSLRTGLSLLARKMKEETNQKPAA